MIVIVYINLKQNQLSIETQAQIIEQKNNLTYIRLINGKHIV